ncbi:T-complex protein 1 subunit alpha [Sphaeroforma arctica JP610]|uniref:T-complex protein 1 subunit alpha n=1 Tax=Sphaeroforma arctica JP610 TaxID=667725 RepID=A0A0L0FU07_9EUKA|nr:T-complex protein 1 subunit alpha [Sphaeroforma arctica JP610]KNC80134.1 T-complex protein 1 subunit alpha [Sphaeroforma arctica JP610]|eukprot:XP_014154036.1 T-complex protein 1 subunit alpha [Sphaeroforma arctica JP610]
MSLANTVKSSLGPVGLDKMLVDDVGDVTITNDGATILSLLEVEHPAAKVLVELAGLQDSEVGDGTTSVVILAAELLKNAGELVDQKIHPTAVIAGYLLAMKQAQKFIQKEMTLLTEDLGRDSLINCAKTSMYSKIIGTDMDFFSEIVVDAMLATKRVNAKGNVKCPVGAVNVLKAHGARAKDTRLVHGYALNCTIASQAMVKSVTDAKIVCLDVNLQKQKLALGVQVQVSDAHELEKIKDRESEINRMRAEMILATGANVVLTTKGIDDEVCKLMIARGVMGIRRCKKEDLKRIARITGATLISSLADMEGDESFDASSLGYAESVAQERISDDELIIIKGTKAYSSASIILRGANDFMCDEMERAVHDSLCVVRGVIESGKVVPGGGAVEAALSLHLENYALSLESRSQIAIAAFAKAMLVIPKTLCVNAAKDTVELVSQLRAAHNTAQQARLQDTPSEADLNLKWIGLDLHKGETRDNVAAGILEPAQSKIKSIKFATEAAITILRIDEAIRIQPTPSADDDPHSYEKAMARGQL